MSLRGIKAAQQSAAGFARTTFFSLKDGDSATIRFLTDADPTEVEPGVLAGGWITVLQHQNVQTKAAPAGFQGNWPGHMTAICRAQNLTELGIDSPFADCALCMSGSKQTQRTWALAVLREEVREGGRTTGFRDVTREVVVKEGQPPVSEPAIVVINLGRRNFFGPISGWYGRNGTVLDRDFAVTRTGDGLDTLYNPIGLDPIGVADGRVFDLRDPEFMSRYLPDVEGPNDYATASDKMLVPIMLAASRTPTTASSSTPASRGSKRARTTTRVPRFVAHPPPPQSPLRRRTMPLLRGVDMACAQVPHRGLLRRGYGHSRGRGPGRRTGPGTLSQSTLGWVGAEDSRPILVWSKRGAHETHPVIWHGCVSVPRRVPVTLRSRGRRWLPHPDPPTPEIPEFIRKQSELLGCVMDIIEEPHIAHTLQGSITITGYPGFNEVADSFRSAPSETDGESFVHIHTHSEFSSLDGFSTIDEIVAAAVADGQPAIAVTDHGTCAAHPHLQAACEDAGINPIFGLEAYFVDDRFRRPLERTKPKKEYTESEEDAFKKDQAEVKDYWHLVLVAMNDTGLRNLWAMSTEANRDGFYYKPRLDWDTLERYSEGVICTTACLRGPVSRAILANDLDLAHARLARLQGIFEDRLYAEVHTNHLQDQFKVNDGIVKLAEELNVPCIAVVDSHYSCCEHKDAHKVWIAAQTSSNINEEAGLFDSDEDYHLMTREEVRLNLAYMGTAKADEWIANTGKLADRCTARLAGDPTPPMFGDSHDEDFDTLCNMCEFRGR